MTHVLEELTKFGVISVELGSITLGSQDVSHEISFGLVKFKTVFALLTLQHVASAEHFVIFLHGDEVSVES